MFCAWIPTELTFESNKCYLRFKCKIMTILSIWKIKNRHKWIVNVILCGTNKRTNAIKLKKMFQVQFKPFFANTNLLNHDFQKYRKRNTYSAMCRALCAIYSHTINFCYIFFAFDRCVYSVHHACYHIFTILIYRYLDQSRLDSTRLGYKNSLRMCVRAFV